MKLKLFTVSRFVSLFIATLTATTSHSQTVSPGSAASGTAVNQSDTSTGRLRAYSWVKPPPPRSHVSAMMDMATASPGNSLPLWTFFTESSRDYNAYTGVMVGQNPFDGGGTATVPTYIVPLVIRTHEIGTSVDQKGNITTTPGVTTFNPAVADRASLTPPNDVPLTLVQQSPIFNDATFDFGGTIVGTTQYVDAFQRANFWAVDNHANYHTLLHPVKTLAPIVIDVPKTVGLALATTSLGPPAFKAPLGIVDLNWFDYYIDAVVLPALASQGVSPSNFPIFLVHNVVWASPVNNLGGCCVLGYHGYAGLPIQTYSPVDFDTSGAFAPNTSDTAVMSHEVAEWMNDPFATNATPPWGNTGQVIGACQNNLEVGDPLSGTDAPPIVMANGFTYHLQELAFFSWFFGSPSIGIHGWYSNNGTFLQDAGPPCSTPSTTSSAK